MEILEDLFNIYTGVCLCIILTIGVVYCYIGLAEFKNTKTLENIRLQAEIDRLRRS